MRVEGRVDAARRRGVRRVLGDAARRARAAARPPRASRSRSARARSSRRRSRRSPPSRRGRRAGAAIRLVPETLRVLAAPRRPPARASPVQAKRRRAGRCYSCNREAARRSRSSQAWPARPPRRRRSSAAAPSSPPSSVWNAPVDKLPVARRLGSADRARSASAARARRLRLGLWDGSRIGIPYVVVHGKTTPKSQVAFDYADESDKGPYPIPPACRSRARRSLDEGDRHALIVDRDACRLYELYALHRSRAGAGPPGSGAIWNLRSNALRPAGLDVGRRRRACRSCPGLRAGAATRRPDASTTRCASRCSARAARTSTRRATTRARPPMPSLPPMGLRVRLKASVNIARLPEQARIVAQAMKTLRDDRRRQRLELVRVAARPTRIGRTTSYTRSAR